MVGVRKPQLNQISEIQGVVRHVRLVPVEQQICLGCANHFKKAFWLIVFGESGIQNLLHEDAGIQLETLIDRVLGPKIDFLRWLVASANGNSKTANQMV